MDYLPAFFRIKAPDDVSQEGRIQALEKQVNELTTLVNTLTTTINNMNQYLIAIDEAIEIEGTVFTPT